MFKRPPIKISLQDKHNQMLKEKLESAQKVTRQELAECLLRELFAVERRGNFKVIDGGKK